MNKQIILVLSFTIFALFSCKKEDKDSQVATDSQGYVSFTSSMDILENAKISGINIESVSRALVTIKKSDGTSINYELKELKLYNMNNQYFTEKIALNSGEYQITEFFLIDGEGNTIYATPTEGSNQAQNVSNPLPIFFTIETNVSTDIPIEVIETAGMSPEDFGLTWFPIIEVETFSFLISVSELGTNTLLSANLEISNDDYTFYQLLDTIVNNVVRIKDGYSNYTLKVSRNGYNTYTETFTNEELKQYSAVPLVIELTQGNGIPADGLLAYYPFLNNAEDYSGNGYHATVYGASMTSDRYGNANSAYIFDGFNDKVLLPSDFDLPERTVCFWFNANNIPEWNYPNDPNSLNIIYTSDHPQIENGLTKIWVTKVNGISKLCFHNGNPDSVLASSYNINEDEWYLGTVTVTQTSIKYYINGELMKVKNFPGNIHSTYDNGFYNSALGAGRLLNHRFFSGKIDDIRIYNRALNNEEIVALYNE